MVVHFGLLSPPTSFAPMEQSQFQVHFLAIYQLYFIVNIVFMKLESHPVTNVMDNLVVGKDSDETWPELVIHNLMRLDSVAPLLANGSLTLRAELELFGHGTRVYREVGRSLAFTLI